MADKTLHRKLKIEHNELTRITFSLQRTHVYSDFFTCDFLYGSFCEKWFVTGFFFFTFSDIRVSWSLGLIICSSIRIISSIRISYDGPREGAVKTFRTESIKWYAVIFYTIFKLKNIIINWSYNGSTVDPYICCSLHQYLFYISYIYLSNIQKPYRWRNC